MNQFIRNQNITKKQLFTSQHLDRDFYLDMFAHVTNGSPTKGYKQRIGLAAAMIHDPKILILDEPTSALDPMNDLLITSALTNLLTNKTSILIAHKLSSIRNVDKVIFLENGTIKEFGNFNELFQRKGLFYNHFFEQGVMHEKTIHH